MEGALIDFGNSGVILDIVFQQTRVEGLLMGDDGGEVDGGCRDVLDD